MPYRTPDEHFEDLPGFPCLHGEPTWGYLYRHMIPPLAEDHRVVVPDFIGFGRSDKWTAVGDYSFARHYETLRAFVETLDLSDVTLVVQDWGGLLGLAYAARHPERIARLVVLNTFLPTGTEEKPPAFRRWRRFVEAAAPDLPIARILREGLAAPDRLSDAEAAAYEAPFPTPESKAGAVAWPLLIPMSPDDPGADAMRETRARLAEWSKPAFILFAPEDPILGGARPFFLDLLPTARKQPDVTVDGASHFLPEEKGPLLARHILDFIARTA